MFCDHHLYCICPFFGLAVFFLYGGLLCDGVSDAIKDFLFPKLHNMRKGYVATRLTKTSKMC